MSIKELTIWFILAVIFAVTSIVGLIVSIAFARPVWEIVFIVQTVIGCIHLGAVGVFYIAEKEIEGEEKKSQKLIEEFCQFCEEENQRKADDLFDEFKGGKK